MVASNGKESFNLRWELVELSRQKITIIITIENTGPRQESWTAQRSSTMKAKRLQSNIAKEERAAIDSKEGQRTWTLAKGNYVSRQKHTWNLKDKKIIQEFSGHRTHSRHHPPPPRPPAPSNKRSQQHKKKKPFVIALHKHPFDVSLHTEREKLSKDKTFSTAPKPHKKMTLKTFYCSLPNPLTSKNNFCNIII